MDDVYWKNDSCCNKVFHNLPTSRVAMISYSQSDTDAVVSNCQLQWDIGLAQSDWDTATLYLTALVIFDKTVWNRIHLCCFMRNLNCEIQGFIVILSFYLGRAEVFLVCTNSSKTAMRPAGQFLTTLNLRLFLASFMHNMISAIQGFIRTLFFLGFPSLHKLVQDSLWCLQGRIGREENILWWKFCQISDKTFLCWFRTCVYFANSSYNSQSSSIE